MSDGWKVQIRDHWNTMTVEVIPYRHWGGKVEVGDRHGVFHTFSENEQRQQHHETEQIGVDVGAGDAVRQVEEVEVPQAVENREDHRNQQGDAQQARCEPASRAKSQQSADDRKTRVVRFTKLNVQRAG